MYHVTMVRLRVALWVMHHFFLRRERYFFLNICLIILLAFSFVMMHLIQSWNAFFSHNIFFFCETVELNHVFVLSSSFPPRILPATIFSFHQRACISHRRYPKSFKKISLKISRENPQSFFATCGNSRLLATTLLPTETPTFSGPGQPALVVPIAYIFFSQRHSTQNILFRIARQKGLG